MKKKLPKQIKTQNNKSKLEAVVEAAARASKFDTNGGYTGNPVDNEHPVQDADDL